MTMTHTVPKKIVEIDYSMASPPLAIKTRSKAKKSS